MCARPCATIAALVLIGCGVLSIVASSPALADWGEAGAQYSCDQQHQSFELLPYDQSSSDPHPAVKAGFTQIVEGQPPITCQLGRHTLHAEIEVFPPAAWGECAGGGAVRARSVSVDDVELLPDAPSFDSACPGSDNDLMHLLITVTGAKLSVERCYESSTQAGKNGCATEQIDIDAIARQQAREDHDLASPDVQAAQSAAKLPSEDDLANVYRSPGAATAAVPICAHTRPEVMRLGDIVPGESAVTPTGRISGSAASDRVYIHPVNPQVCDAQLDTECKAKSYIIPGDRVKVSYICGQWTYIHYPRRTNAVTDIDGWVPTDRIYGTGPLITPYPGRWKTYWMKFSKDDALYMAVADRDATQVRKLLADGKQHFDQVAALRLAVSSQDLGLVEAVLARPIDFKADCPKVMDWAVYTSPEVLHALVHAGLDLSCKPEVLPRLAGANRISDADLDLSARGAWIPLRDMPGRVDELLTAGIPVDSALPDGATALFRTIGPNNVDVAQLLLKKGADPNIVLHDSGGLHEDAGVTPLIEATMAYSSLHDPTMVELLLEGGANPNYRTAGDYKEDDDEPPGAQRPLAGVTALIVAARDGELQLAKLLLQHGADPKLPRSDFVLPVDIARANGHEEVASLIESYVKPSGNEGLETLVKARFGTEDYDGGIHAVELRTKAVTALSGEQAVDARFDLRTLALSMNQETASPTEKRLALLQAASPSYVIPGFVDSADEIRSDAIMFQKATDQFGVQDDPAGALQALVLGLTLDDRLPDDQKLTLPWEFNLALSVKRTDKDYLGKVLTLARITGGNKVKTYAYPHCVIASAIYNAGLDRVRSGDDSSSQEQAQQLAELADALSDTKCGLPEYWQWRLVVAAGIDYQQLGLMQQGSDAIQHAIQLIHGNDKPADRVLQGNLLLSDLLDADLEYPWMCSYAKELQSQVVSLDGSAAMEARVNLKYTFAKLDAMPGGCQTP